jgi:microcystin-dependent protein
MYSGVWPPLDASNNTPYGITNMFSSNRWILCNGGPATAPTWPDPLPSGVLNYAYTIPTGNVQGKITIGVPNSTITLTIPDLRGRFVMGYVGTTNFAYSGTISSANTTNQQLLAQTTNQTGINIQGVANYPGGINNFGGVMTQSISVNEMPSHLHTIPAHSHTMQHQHQIRSTYGTSGGNEQGTYIGRDNGVGGSGGRQVVSYVQEAATNAAFNPLITVENGTYNTGQVGPIDSGNKGDDLPRSKLPPYWVLAYIMRIG